MNALSTIAAAIKTNLAGGTLAGLSSPAGYQVERHYVPPDYVAKATRDLKICVVQSAESVDVNGENANRSEADHLYTIRVAMVKRVEAPDITAAAALPELDGLSDVREAMIDRLNANRVMGDATLESLNNDPAAYDGQTLDQKKVFLSVIELKYRLLR